MGKSLLKDNYTKKLIVLNLYGKFKVSKEKTILILTLKKPSKKYGILFL
jgi:hypothetical protein